MQIANQCVAQFHYTLTDDSGVVIDSSEGREPLAYLHGAGNIVPGLEKELEGKSVGDKFSVSVPPEQGYGPRHEGLTQVVPIAAFQGVETVEAGMQFSAQGPQGPMQVVVSKVENDQVTIDASHPLAGKTLNFAVEVTEVRQATPDELEHGHVHGVGGHGH